MSGNGKDKGNTDQSNDDQSRREAAEEIAKQRRDSLREGNGQHKR